MRPTAIAEDCTVPVAQLVPMFREVAKIAEKYDLLIPIVAHAGDGNLHPQILTDIRDKEEMKRVEKAIDEISDKSVELGGTLTGVNVARALNHSQFSEPLRYGRIWLSQHIEMMKTERHDLSLAYMPE